MARRREIDVVAVLDIAAASAYYASVFDAEFPSGKTAGKREMRIGERRYRLVRQGEATAAPRRVAVADVDVAIARAATRGGRIVDAAHRTPEGREGRIEDPYGNCWIVADG